jgi:hypothetical protein
MAIPGTRRTELARTVVERDLHHLASHGSAAGRAFAFNVPRTALGVFD